jgi:hypothetical protein
MPATICPVDNVPLLEELLDVSARIYHRNVATIQRVFHERWLELLHAAIGRDQIEEPDAKPALVEARARDGLSLIRRALREKQAALMREERNQRALRDRGIRRYVASLDAAPRTPSAA